MKILTLNTWQERGAWQGRWEVILEGIRKFRPDIVAFQELFNKFWALEVRNKTGFPAMVFPKEHSGLVIYSNYPVSKSGELVLTRSPLEEYGRYLLWAELKAGKENFFLFSTHLSWKLEDSATRKKQAEEVLKFIQTTAKNKEAVLVGDLNAPPHSDEIRGLIKEGNFLDLFQHFHPQKNGFTWDNRNPYAAGSSHKMPDRRIDQILVRGNGSLLANPASCDLIYTEPKDGVWASDHAGVLGDFE